MKTGYLQIEVLGFLKRNSGRAETRIIVNHLNQIGLVYRATALRSTRRILNTLYRRGHILLGPKSAGQTAELTKKELPPGICRICGCTEFSGCEEGCGWTDETKTHCTECER